MKGLFRAGPSFVRDMAAHRDHSAVFHPVTMAAFFVT